MPEISPFDLNIEGVTDLVGNETNKVSSSYAHDEGISSDAIDELALDLTDEELLELRKGYETKSAPYIGKIEPRQKANKAYLLGTQNNTRNGKTAPSNLLFSSTATFVPQALAKNPEPVVWSDNTDEGKTASGDIKTMLQFHADRLCLRKSLGLLVWHWSVYFLAVMKHGWDIETNDIKSEVRKPSNFVLDPDGYVDVKGDFRGAYLGERIQSTAQELIDLYPESKTYITEKVGMKFGTSVVRTEWWTNAYCFTTYEEHILDKHKNEFYNYEDGKPNHFALPKMPYTFLSVFSLQDQPHDFTNLIEQNIANQDEITETDSQVMKNLRHSNNAILLDDAHFTMETGKQAADAVESGDPILAPKDTVQRLPSNPLPDGLLNKLEVSKQTLMAIYGVQGLSPQDQNSDTTARGMILNQSHDSTRIGGGIGDALEQVADNVFNWWTQLYYVFYDEKHYAAIMGAGRAVEYVSLQMADEQRRFVVSVSPNSMVPKDELTRHNQALDLFKAQALDPISLFKELDYSDPMETAKQTALWITNPQLYIQQMFPEMTPEQPQDSANPPNPTDVTGAPQAPQDPNISQEPASSSLANVPLT